MTDDEIINQAIDILESRLSTRLDAMTSTNAAKNFLKLQFNGLEYESFRVLYLDSQHRLITCEEMFKGTIDGAAVYPREVVKAALSFNAAAVILSHNHPSGVAEPSQADIAITQKLQSALSLIDVRTLDHIVVGGIESVSFAERGLV